MADEFGIFDFLENDATLEARQQRAEIRSQSDPFRMDDIQFIKRYRLSKQLVINLCDELRPHMSRPNKSTDLSIESKILTALSFYATGSYQRPTGDIAGHSVAQPTVSTVLAEVTRCLNLPQFRAKYIRFPQSSAERRENVQKFYNKFGIPGVIGCIDCTQIGIVRPNEHEERFFCRKQYHSLNVQIICNADSEIISVDASWGGATHDSFIWANHPLKPHLDELSRTEGICLLGDSGYPQRRSMMTPILNAVPGSAEAHFTDVQVRARNTVERTIGLLKTRFRCLLVHRILHYSPTVAGSIVNACVILHNICNRANVSVGEELDARDRRRETQLQVDSSSHQSSASATTSASELNDGLAARRDLVNRLWMSRRA